MKYKILKRIGLLLFVCSFVLNVVFTSYAHSMIKTYNTGAEIIEGVGAVLSGGGPFFALVGCALLAAGLVCEATSDDPTDGALEYFVSDCIVNDHFANTSLEYIYRNLVIDDDGNIDYKQVVDNINEYVQAKNIVISTGAAVEFKNNMLYVCPEIINAMAHDYREWFNGSISNKYGLKTYVDSSGNFGLTFGWRSDIPVNSDLYNLYMHLVPSSEETGNYHSSYFLFTSLGDTPLNVSFSGNSVNCKYMLYYERDASGPTYYTGRWLVQQEYLDTLYFVTHSGGLTEPCINFYDENGSLLETVVQRGQYFFLSGCNAVSWYGGSLYNLGYIIGMTDSIPDSNRIYIGPVDTSSDVPLRDLYEDILDAALDVPVVDFPVADDKPIVIDGDMVNDLDKAFENVIGVVEGIGENAGEKDKDVADEISKELEAVRDNAEEREEENIKNPSVPSSPSVGFPEIGDLKTDGLIDKFPFCIPFDLISLIKAFEAEPEAPYIEIPFVVPVIGASDNIVIDCSKFEYIAVILRSLEVVGFTLFLILKTRDLIKG